VSDHKDYRSARGHVSPVESRIIWTICGIQKELKGIICTSVACYLWNVTSRMLRTINCDL